MRNITFIAGILSFVVASPLSAATLLLTPDGTGDAPTIQAAVTACVDGDVIELADGVYAGAGNWDVDYEGKAITIGSQSGDPDLVVIEVGGTSLKPRRGFVFRSGEGLRSILENVTVTGGWAPLHHDGGDYDGGGVLCCGGSPQIINCVFRHNEAAGTGGGLAICHSASPLVRETVFHGNIAGRNGGGAGVSSIARPEFAACVFSGNYANLQGGALFVTTGASVSLLGCEFYANEALLGGVVRQVNNSTGRYYGCLFVRNIGRTGVFQVVGSSSAVVEESTLYGNIGASSFFVTGAARLDLRNTIVAFGEGRAITAGDADEKAVTISCTNIFGNTGGDWTSDIAKQLTVQGNLAADPLFCDVEGGDFTLAFNSPCLLNFCGRIGAFGSGCGGRDVYDDEHDTASRMLDVSRNPARGTVELHYVGAAGDTPVISVHNVGGRLVRTYTPAASSGTVVWDGTNASGRPVATGTYFVRVVAGGRSEASRILWIR